MFSNYNAAVTKSQMVPNKTLFYHGDGTGRDTYIYNFNGGFSPEKSPCKVEELGKFKIDFY
jgi:hypothetical protein